MVVEEAMMCKIFACTPKQLDEQEFMRVNKLKLAYMEIFKKNPMMMFA